MQYAVILFVIIVLIATYSSWGEIQKPAEISKPKEQAAIYQTLAPEVKKEIKKEPSFLIDTYIVSAPEEGAVINDTNQINFEFGAKVSPEIAQEEISFETKLEGLDSDWLRTWTNQRTINFPGDVKEYTFWVRAKARDSADPTPAQRTFTIQLSLYFNKVKISGVSHSSISLIPKTEEEINITNWRVVGKKGEIIIPQGQELFIPGKSLPMKDMSIRKRGRVYLQSEANPFQVNVAFRPNQCFGYLVSYYDSISLPFSYKKICPRIDQDDPKFLNLSDYCQNFVFRLEKCQTGDYFNDPKIYLDWTCNAYIDNYIANNLNYEKCIENYSRNKDFLTPSWYFYTGHDILGRRRDTLYLYDKNHLLVDKYYYQSKE